MRSKIYSLFTALVCIATTVTAVATPMNPRDLDKSNHVLVDSYTLDNGIGVKVFAEKTAKAGDTVDVAARAAFPASPASGTLEKRQDIQGWSCSTQCWWNSLPQPNIDDCTGLYNGLHGSAGVFSVSAHNWLVFWAGQCSIALVNSSGQDITYDYWDFGGTAQWLTGDCISNQGASVGVCLYDGISPNVAVGAYTIVAPLAYWN